MLDLPIHIQWRADSGGTWHTVEIRSTVSMTVEVSEK